MEEGPHPMNRGHFIALANLSGNWIDRARKGQLNREIVLDMDSNVPGTREALAGWLGTEVRQAQPNRQR